MASLASRLIPYLPFALALVCSAAAGGATPLGALYYAIGFAALLIGLLTWVRTYSPTSLGRALTLYAFICATSLTYFLPSLTRGTSQITQSQLLSTGLWAGTSVMIILLGQMLARRMNWRRGNCVALITVLAAFLSVGVAWVHTPSEKPPISAALLPVAGFWPGVADAIGDNSIEVDLPRRHQPVE